MTRRCYRCRDRLRNLRRIAAMPDSKVAAALRQYLGRIRTERACLYCRGTTRERLCSWECREGWREYVARRMAEAKG